MSCGSILKQVYYDGHEREDVKKYRKAWAARMIHYHQKMKKYPTLDDPLGEEPTLGPGDVEHMLVTHDECIFYANDDVSKTWMAEKETRLRKKGPGLSIMVSDFLCPCHGRLVLSPAVAEEVGCAAEAREIIHPGTNRMGYWKSEDMLKQLKDKAIPIFNILHPGCKGTSVLYFWISCVGTLPLSTTVCVFVFDQSSNHNA